MNEPEQRTYSPAESVTFRKTNEPFGGLSNMAPGFPLVLNRVHISTAEALYQCCRFPNHPEVQKLIVSERSPMTAKMRSKPFRHLSREDWHDVRVLVMRWCLRVKLAQNWQSFKSLLLSTGTQPIVEDSHKDQFWGAKLAEDGVLVGRNVLGRLLMELREELRGPKVESLKCVMPPDIPNFLFLGRPIGPLSSDQKDSTGMSQPSSESNIGTRRTVAVSGVLTDRNWADLVHFLSASGIMPEQAHLEIELRFNGSSEQTQSKLKVLEAMVRRFGISYQSK
jgi:ribA/ribD-fused uncharacterized protein